MAGAVVMGHRLVGVALRLISIAIFMYDAGAIHHDLPGNLARMDRRRQPARVSRACAACVVT
jgi:hypothetical protein